MLPAVAGVGVVLGQRRVPAQVPQQPGDVLASPTIEGLVRGHEGQELRPDVPCPVSPMRVGDIGVQDGGHPVRLTPHPTSVSFSVTIHQDTILRRCWPFGIRSHTVFPSSDLCWLDRVGAQLGN